MGYQVLFDYPFVHLSNGVRGVNKPLLLLKVISVEGLTIIFYIKFLISWNMINMFTLLGKYLSNKWKVSLLDVYCDGRDPRE